MIGLAMLVLLVVALAFAMTSHRPEHRHVTEGGRVLVKVDDLDAALDRWVAGGIVTTDQASRLRAEEVARLAVVAPPAARRSLAAEALGYLGGALVVAAIALTVGQSWEDLSTAARIAVLAVATAIVFVAGLWVQRREEAPLERFGSLMWLLTVGGVAGLSAEVMIDAAGFEDSSAAIAITAVVAIVAGALWFVRRLPLQHLALLGGVIALAMSLLSLSESTDQLSIGMVLWGIGSAWAALAWAHLLPPRAVGVTAGVVATVVGAQIVASDDTRAIGLVLGVATAAGLMGWSISSREVILLGVGTVALFMFVPQLVLHFLGDALGPQVAMLLGGALLLLLALFVSRVHGEMFGRHGPRDRFGRRGHGPAALH